MAKKDISSIILTGTPKQRMMLLANHIAETSTDKPGFLTDSEFDKLTASFKTPAEIRIYNKYRNANRIFSGLLPYLAQLRLQYKLNSSKFNTFFSLIMVYHEIEGVLNEALFIADSNKKLREKLLSLFLNSSLIFVDSTKVQDEDGREYIEFELDKDKEYILRGLVFSKPDGTTEELPGLGVKGGLEGMADKMLRRNSECLAKIKGVLTALKEFIEEEDIQIKAYNDFIKEVEEEVTNDDTGMMDYPYCPKYSEIDMDVDEYNYTKKHL